MYVAIDLANTHVHCIIMSVIDNTVIGNILVYTTANCPYSISYTKSYVNRCKNLNNNIVSI